MNAPIQISYSLSRELYESLFLKYTDTLFSLLKSTYKYYKIIDCYYQYLNLSQKPISFFFRTNKKMNHFDYQIFLIQIH